MRNVEVPMKTFRNWLITAVAIAGLAACGGSDPYVPGSGSPAGAPTAKGSFTAVVSFGDSVSDVGTYTPATSVTGDGNPPYMGGKFTTNTDTSTVWVENVAAALGLIVTPAEVGFAGVSVPCPAAANPALAHTCTAYGQGGALVTDPDGVRHGAGALTVPIKTQIANHLARFGSFKDSDLIFIQAGGNDLFTQMDPTKPDSFPVKVAMIQADAAVGKITADQAKTLLFQAQTESQAAMKQAAVDLAGYIRSEILAKGGKYVVVMNMPDLAATPEGMAYPAEIGAVLTTLSDTFNLWLREGVTGQPVAWVDLEAMIRGVVADPAAYGMANASVPACDAAKMSAITGGKVTDGFALFCNATAGSPLNGIRDGADINTWFFADGNHPTVGGHKLLSDAILEQLQAMGWI